MTDLTPIHSAARKAALLARLVQQAHFTAADKATDDPVTIADYGAQAILCRAIRDSYPGDAIIAEEHGSQFLSLLNAAQRARILTLLTDVLDVNVTQDDVLGWLEYGKGSSAARTWIIDPIDGTKGFISGRHYAIGIGVLEGDSLTGSVIAAPGYPYFEGEAGALFYTADGSAFIEPLAGGEPRRLRVSDRASIESVRVVESIVSKHKDADTMSVIRQLAGIGADQISEIDSMEKYGWLAADHADLYVRLPRGADYSQHFIWDHAAGVALVTAAGGRCTDLDGSPLDFTQGSTLARNRGVVATNGVIHETIIAAIQQATGS